MFAFESVIGFPLPDDFKEFYLICNGFSCNEDLFNMLPLAQVLRYTDNYGKYWFDFCEYMIYSDTWGLRLNSAGKYEIFNGSCPEVPLTSSLLEFLIKYLEGNLVEDGGIYDWQKELGIK